MLSKFSKNIASNYVYSKTSVAALLSASRQVPAFLQTAQYNAMMGGNE